MTEEQKQEQSAEPTATTNENMIPYSRFKQVLSQSSELAEKLAKAENEISLREKRIAELSDNELLKQIQAENERLKKFEGNYYTEKKQNLSKTLEGLSGHPDFEKLKTVVEIPEAVEGKFDTTSLENDKVNAILGKVAEYKALGLFGEVNKKTGGNGQTFKTGGDDPLFGFESPAELLQKAPDKYKEYRKARGLA